MTVPKGVWGLVTEGESKGCKVIVDPGELGGWDILLYPPAPSDDVWNYWADDDTELDYFFTPGPPRGDPPAWVWPGLLPKVEWGVTPPEGDRA